MNEFWINFGSALVELILAWYFYSNTLRTFNESFKKIILYYSSYGLILSFASFWPSSLIPVRILALIICSLLGNHFTYRPKWLKNIYITILFYSSIVIADVLGGGLLTLCGLPVHLNLSGVERFVYYSIAHILALLILYCIATFLNRNRYNVPLRHHAIPLILCQIASAYACYQSFFSLMNGSNSTAVIVEVLCLLYINVTICVYVERLKYTYLLREQAKIAEQKLRAQQAYYQDAIERQEETRTLWHDIKKYLLAMESLVQKGEHDKIGTAYEEIRGKFKYLENVVDVENPIVNGILAYAVGQTREAGIDLTMDIWVGNELRISPSDLYVIIGNTVDNATEACSQLPKENRKIHIILRQTNHMLFFEISSLCDPEHSDIYKKTGQIHGYGLRNVEKCVKDNSGDMNISKNESVFTVSIQLTV